MERKLINYINKRRYVLSKEIKYKNFIPLSKIEDNNKKKMKRIKMFTLVLLAINIYFLPLNIMKSFEGKVEYKKEDEFKKEDVTINMINELSKYDIDKFNIENNVMKLEVDQDKKSDIIEFLESKSLNLKEIERNNDKVNIKVEI